jgi:hypothetical protein
MLDFGNGWDAILVFYKKSGGLLAGEYGIHPAYGIPKILAILFGVVLPLCLFAAAAFLAFGRRKA